VKAKKLTLLIALITLVGTFTSVIPPQVFADLLPDDFCLDLDIPALTPNSDDHDLNISVNPTGPPFQVQLSSMYETPGADTPLSSLVRFFVHENNALIFAGTPVKGAFVGLIESTDESHFTGTFNQLPFFSGLTEGNYVGFQCGKETEGISTPSPIPGVHHSDTQTFRIDRTDPFIECQDLFFNQLEAEGSPIPRTDSRFDDFFGRGNPATSFLTVTDNLDDDVDVIDTAPANIPVGQDVFVTFTATDDGDIPTASDGNTFTDTCKIFITPFEREGCEGVILDQSGAPQEIEVCLEIPVREADCGLAILGTDPSLNYGTLSQDGTSLIQLLQVNRGNAPALLKVAAGDPLDIVNTPGFWINPNEAPEPPNTPPPPPPFTEQMPAASTHFSLIDPGTTDPTALAAFYDSGDSFAVNEFDRVIIVPILNFNEITDIFWQLRIILLEILFFGDLQQTLTLELQECSFANECEILGFTCPQTGQLFD